MSVDRGRRQLMASGTALAGVSALGAACRPLDRLAPTHRTPSNAFDFDDLVARARRLADTAYVPPERRYPKVLEKLDYEAFIGITTPPGRALWADAEAPFAIEFFPLDRSAPYPVKVHVVDNGRATRLRFDPSMFEFADPELAKSIPPDLGFSGFRVRDKRHDDQEWLAFKGASYFRAPGAKSNYGLSARGVALDTGYGADETFPRFSEFWIERPAPGARTLTIHALLEGERATGAYRMRCRHPGATVMDIDAHLFTRGGVSRLGIAPLTSMFWFAESNARFGADWRGEIHDSDGLAMTTGAGEHIWRALGNPPRPHYSAFTDDNPRGFGLVQRDRAFDHYQDSNVFYERRPSLWVTPGGHWGRGHVGLLELPTAKEVYDNINVFWVPGVAALREREWRFGYRLDWYADDRHRPALARVVATRTGRAGEPGTYDQQPELARKFVIDFEGTPVAELATDAEPAIDVAAGYGEIVNPYAKAIADTGRWRVFFDWRGARAADPEPVDLRCRLTHRGQPLTETWMYAYFPRALPAAG